MKTKMKIFNVILLSVLCLAPGLSRGDDGECGYFNPAFALCSTHSHNIGYTVDDLPANPDKSEEVSQMNHIIALKTTLMAQQLKEQYDTLSVIIKRFKTQLEKAVLVSKIEVATGNAASGNSGGGSSGSYSSGGGAAISGAADCSGFTDVNGIAQCLQPNIQKVINAANSGKITDARNQLKNDLTIAKRWNLCYDGDTEDAKPSECQYYCCTKLAYSSSASSASRQPTISNVSSFNKNDLVDCAQDFSAKLSLAVRCLQNKNSYPSRTW